MFIQRVALEQVPTYAVVEQPVVADVLQELTGGDLRAHLDQVFRRVEMQQPALGELISGELAAIEGAPGQALAYFLLLVVYRSFEEAFGTRLGEISDVDIERVFQRLVVDGEVRRQSCTAGSFSEDMVAVGQPALMALIGEECDRAAETAPDVDRIFEALLIEVLALTEAVAPIC
ncbi:MAG: hypothetical protein OXT09_32370 [Myxococcales bacterium]|nr:hypothetical protein [Myxococcales bacterium]